MAIDQYGQKLGSKSGFKSPPKKLASKEIKIGSKKGKQVKLKKLISALMLLVVSVIGCRFASADSPYPNDIVVYSLGTGVTNMAASSTNTTVGFNYSIDNVFKGARIYASATTYTNVGQLNIYFRTSADGTLYDTPRNSNIKLVLTLTNSASANVASTNTVQGLFDVTGIARIQSAVIENQSGTSVSNINIIISYPYDIKTQNR